jgi:hypothetical protein
MYQRWRETNWNPTFSAREKPFIGNSASGMGSAVVRTPGADLLSNYLSQRLIDPVLPARSGFLKVIKNIPVNSQRDKLLGIRDSWRLRREFRRLRGCHLECRFSRIA